MSKDLEIRIDNLKESVVELRSRYALIFGETDERTESLALVELLLLQFRNILQKFGTAPDGLVSEISKYTEVLGSMLKDSARS